MKHIYISLAKSALLLVILLLGTYVHAQTTPALYNQSGQAVNGYNAGTNSLTAGWYYTSTGAPRYYYANGVYYDPATQSYGGEIIYPNADGPQSLNSVGQNLTPGVPNTGVGGRAFYAWISLIISTIVAVVGAHYLTRSKAP